MRSGRVIVLWVAVGLLFGAVPADAAPKGKARLKTFSSCGALVDYAHRYAPRQVGPSGVLVRGVAFAPPTPVGRGEAVPTSSAPGASPLQDDSSTTNVQEAGVDEPDLVKSDGRTIFALANGVLNSVDARAAKPVVLDTLKAVAATELLIHDGRAIVISSSYGGPSPVAGVASSPIYAGHPTTTLTEVDVSNPADLKLLRTYTVDGGYVSARLTGRTARIVVSSPPRAFALPPVDGPATAQETQARYRQAIRKAGIARWRPRGTLRDLRRGRRKTVRRAAVACRSVARPASFSGVNMLTVLTVDMAKGLPVVDSDALLTDAQTVYANKTSLYVASERWVDPRTQASDLPDGSQTAIHRFATADPDSTTYASSGAVTGYILNQFSLSEDKGVLRVATTDAPQWLADAPPGERQSHVTVLDGQNGQLVRIGQVSGLGKGERIYAVRFLGDRGYVVTFRQTDPLYVIDLEQPTRPAVRGELKILGYSAYLHPIADDLLLGIGQDATEQGRTQGTQLSLFDVGNPAAPKRIAQEVVAKGSSSAVEYDHRAFLWWAPSALAVLPVNVYGEGDGRAQFTGAIGFSVTKAKGIAELGRLSQKPDPGSTFSPSIDRTLVVGKRIFTVSYSGVGVNDLDTLAGQSFVAFPDAPPAGGGGEPGTVVAGPAPPR